MGLFMVGLFTVAALTTAPPPAALVASLRSGLDGGDRAVVRVEPGPLGLEILTVAVQGAYPGTGVRRVALWEGRSFGVHGERDFAALARVRRWTKQPPSATELLAIFNVCDREGLEAVEASSARVVLTPGRLELSYIAVNPMHSEDKTAVRVVISGKKRAATVTRAALTRGPVVPVGSTAPPAQAEAVPLASAVASGDAMAILLALQRLTPAEASSSATLLAAVSLSPVETLSVEALAKVPVSEEGYAALRGAWAGLPEPRRKALVALALELHGAAFADHL